MKANRHNKKPKKFPMIKYLKITFVYFVLFVAISGLIDYYALMVFNFLWFIVISLILAVIIGYVHIRRKKHDHIDDVADELL